MVSARRYRGPNLMAIVLQAMVVAALVFGLVILGIGGWIISGRLQSDYLVPSVDRPLPHARVKTFGTDALVLEVVSSRPGYVDREGWWAFDTDVNFGLVGEIRDVRTSEVVRNFVLLGGTSMEAGKLVYVHPWAFGRDPTEGLNLAYEELSLDSPLGPLGGWFVEGRTDTWAVVLRDAGDERRAALRLLSILAESGLPTVALDYRNQGTSPADPSGLHRFGATEWEDLERAVEFAREGGARRVIIFGMGMGGSVTMSFLYQSELAEVVSGVVLDAPHLDPRESLVSDVEETRVPLLGFDTPGIVAEAAVSVAGWRYDIDWDDVDYVEQADALDVPVLIIHGDRDGEAPLATSVALQVTRPDLVELEIFDGADHDEAWNLERDRYRALIREFVGAHSR